MTIERMDHLGIVVEDFAAAVLTQYGNELGSESFEFRTELRHELTGYGHVATWH